VTALPDARGKVDNVVMARIITDSTIISLPNMITVGAKYTDGPYD